MRWRYPRYKIPCVCGCGELIDNRDRWGTRHYYKNGHFFKGKVKIPSDRHCTICGSYKTNVRLHKNGYLNYKWRYHDGKWYCNKCYSKYFENLIVHKVYGPRRVNYKGIRIQLKDNPRKGICSWCGRKIGEGIKKTALHHFSEYHDDDPLKDTIEICVSCHTKENWRLGVYS